MFIVPRGGKSMRFGRHNSKEGELVRREAVIRNMDEFIICGGTIVTGTLEPNNRLAVSKGKIRFLKTGEELSGVKTISAEGLYIAPGLIDLHVHGGTAPTYWTAPANPEQSLLTMEGAVHRACCCCCSGAMEQMADAGCGGAICRQERGLGSWAHTWRAVFKPAFQRGNGTKNLETA